MTESIHPRENRPMPNAALRTLFLAIEEVMGVNGAKAVLNLGGLQRYIGQYPPNNLELDVAFADYGAAQQAVENFYGGAGARAMLTQIGRATFRYGLEEQPAILGLAGLALRMLPEGARIKWMLSRLADAGTKRLNLEIQLEEDVDAFYLTYSVCPCQFRQRHEHNPCCFTTVGTIQEALRWVSGGKHYRVQEIACLNIGDAACRFRIDKKAME
ncbi:MAG: hypothetical protein M5U01_06920 [Ardenticatenaceae bacterium]|nr:hypothetical protein [Ardenticatenaceae bacterium]